MEKTCLVVAVISSRGVEGVGGELIYEDRITSERRASLEAWERAIHVNCSQEVAKAIIEAEGSRLPYGFFASELKRKGWEERTMEIPLDKSQDQDTS